ncbi:MAG: family 16 glycosylhydrolase [Phycisphaerales bacterium]|nr:family 16 glycosylhydrolase [Phycisphaerales bacterium]
MTKAHSITIRCALTSAALALAATNAHAQWSLVWSDEFDGTSLDTSKWEPMIGDGTNYGNPGWGNNELQYYTSRSQNITVQDGNLTITARRENFGGREYTSARLRTLNKADFLYGRIETRAKVPAGAGAWPAFWMLPTNSPYGGWAASGEIDVIETINGATSAHGTIHYGGNWPNNTSNGGSRSGNWSQDFHTYAIEWEPQRIRWFVDGQLYHTAGANVWYSSAAGGNDFAPFDSPFHLLLNLAVGGNWPGPPSQSTPFPLRYELEYVRVYEATQQPYGGTPANIPGVIEAENFDEGAAPAAYFDRDAQNNGGAYRTSTSVDIEATTGGGFNLGWIDNGEWLEYTVNVQQSGMYLARARVASQSGVGAFRLLADGVPAGPDFTVNPTGGWQTWSEIVVPVTLNAGTRVLRIQNVGNSQVFNLDRITFESLSPPCAADWDGSGGQPDSSDFLAYLNDFAQHDPDADLAPPGGDGSWDSSDFLAYLNLYSQGC